MVNKREELIKWIKNNNLNILELTEDITMRGMDTNPNSQAIINGRARIIASVLLGENLIGDNYTGIENFISSNYEILNELKACRDDDYVKLNQIFNDETFKTIVTNLDAESLLTAFIEEKEKNSFEQNQNNQSREREQSNVYSQHTEHKGQINPQKESPYSTYEQNNRMVNAMWGNSEVNPYNNNNNNNPYNSYNHDGINNVQQNQYNNYEQPAPNALDEAYNIGIDCDVNGIRCITKRQSDGSFTFEQEISLNDGKIVQRVNKKIISKEEHDAFINKHKEDIIGLEREQTMDYNGVEYHNQYI